MLGVSILFLVAFFLCLHSGTSSNAAGEAFLSENKLRPGVIELESGLQYKVLQHGNGDSHPTIDSRCTCHYHGTLIDGTVFDSSVDRGQPIDFAPNQVIRGWTEIMQMMVEGDKFEIYVPSELAYGARGSPPKIGPNEVLVFTIEMIQIHGNKVPAITCDPASLNNCNEKEAAYVSKAKEKGLGQEEIDRLHKMAQGKMKPDLADWIKRRLNILRKLVRDSSKEEL